MVWLGNKTQILKKKKNSKGHQNTPENDRTRDTNAERINLKKEVLIM